MTNPTNETAAKIICNEFCNEVAHVTGIEGWGIVHKTAQGPYVAAQDINTLYVLEVFPDGAKLRINSPFGSDTFTYLDALDNIRSFARKYAAALILLEG